MMMTVRTKLVLILFLFFENSFCFSQGPNFNVEMLNSNDAVVEVYYMSFENLTFVPIVPEVLRKDYSIKFVIKGESIQNARLFFQSFNRPLPTKGKNIRVIIDISVKNTLKASYLFDVDYQHKAELMKKIPILFNMAN